MSESHQYLFCFLQKKILTQSSQSENDLETLIILHYICFNWAMKCSPENTNTKNKPHLKTLTNCKRSCTAVHFAFLDSQQLLVSPPISLRDLADIDLCAYNDSGKHKQTVGATHAHLHTRAPTSSTTIHRVEDPKRTGKDSQTVWML